MSGATIFHSDFREFPFWWEAYQPHEEFDADVPCSVQVAIIGAGYAGLAAALQLSKLGIESVVLDAESPGYGASTRSGGLVGGVASVKTPIIGPAPEAPVRDRMIGNAADGLALLEQLIEDEKINCGWTKSGRFTGAWCRSHLEKLSRTAEHLNAVCDANARVVDRDEQAAEIGSAFYHGGLITGAAGHLHPAQYFKGLLDACRRRGITICSHAPVMDLNQHDGVWKVTTSRGTVSAHETVVATNGYTGDVTPQFKRRLIALQPYMIATEDISSDLANSISPKNRSFSDSQRIVTFSRLSSDKKRFLFGSRVKWTDVTPSEMAPHLYRLMIERFPQLEGTRITHAWSGNVALTLDEQPHSGKHDGLHFALGCNGSGVAMMTYLGTQLARKIAAVPDYSCAFDRGSFPTHPLYTGNTRWYLPPIGNYLRVRDWIDRKLL